MFTTGALITAVFGVVGLGSWWMASAVWAGQPTDTLLRFLIVVILGGGLAGLLREHLRLQRLFRRRRMFAELPEL